MVGVAYGFFKLVWWFLAPLVWKFGGDPFKSVTEAEGIHVE